MRRLSNILWCPGRAADARRTGLAAVALLETQPAGRELSCSRTPISPSSTPCRSISTRPESGAHEPLLPERAPRRRKSRQSPPALWGTTSAPWSSPGGRDCTTSSQTASLDLPRGRWPARLRTGEPVHRSRHRPLHPARNDLMLRYFLAEQARAELDQGRWDRAADSAAQVLLLQAVSTLPRIVSLVVLALVRARRGDPDAEPLRKPSSSPSVGELLRIAPVATARAEVAWLTGRLDEIAPVTAAALARDGEAVGWSRGRASPLAAASRTGRSAGGRAPTPRRRARGQVGRGRRGLAPAGVSLRRGTRTGGGR